MEFATNDGLGGFRVVREVELQVVHLQILSRESGGFDGKKSRLGDPSGWECDETPVIPAGAPHNLWNAEELVALIDRHDHVAAYMYGHSHSGNYGTHRHCHYVDFKGMAETESKTAFGIVRCFADRLEIVGSGIEPSRNLEHL